METVKFVVMKAGNNTIRIVPNDIRTKFKKIADGGCCCDVNTVYSVMEYITEECKKIGVIALFEV